MARRRKCVGKRIPSRYPRPVPVPSNRRSRSRCGEEKQAGKYLVRVLERPTIDAVVGRVEAALGEPDDVAVLEGAGADGVEGAIPVKGVPGHLIVFLRSGLLIYSHGYD